MRHTGIVPTGREVSFGENEIIVSKTDLKGAITYANDVFMRVSGYAEHELLGSPHSLIRHPDMPRCVFELLWDTVQRGEEIFAYVNNLAKTGDNYWVFAHVTPSRDAGGRIVGYHSNRRVPYPDALPKVKALYARLRQEERAQGDSKAGMSTSEAVLMASLAEQRMDYAQFVFQLSAQTQLAASTR